MDNTKKESRSDMVVSEQDILETELDSFFVLSILIFLSAQIVERL